MSVSVCLSVCVCACLSVRDNISGITRPIFTEFVCMLPMAVARSSSGSVVICYAFPVLRLRLLAAQLKRSAHAALGLAINCAQ